MDREEQEAIQAVLAGDPDAYRVLMERHLPVILRMTLRVTGSPEDAEEATQDAFLRAYRKLPEFRRDSSFGTWVYRIAVNSALNLVDRRRRDPTWRADAPSLQAHMDVPASIAGHTPETVLLEREHMRERERLLACLTPSERSAFMLRHFEEQPVAAIAEALGTNTNTARQTIFRAVSKLRRAFAQQFTAQQSSAQQALSQQASAAQGPSTPQPSAPPRPGPHSRLHRETP